MVLAGQIIHFIKPYSPMGGRALRRTAIFDRWNSPRLDSCSKGDYHSNLGHEYDPPSSAIGDPVDGFSRSRRHESSQNSRIQQMGCCEVTFRLVDERKGQWAVAGSLRIFNPCGSFCSALQSIRSARVGESYGRMAATSACLRVLWSSGALRRHCTVDEPSADGDEAAKKSV